MIIYELIGKNTFCLFGTGVPVFCGLGINRKKSAIFSFLSYQFGWALVMPEIMISSRSSLRPV